MTLHEHDIQSPAAFARGKRRADLFYLFLLVVPPLLMFPKLGAGILWQDEAETATLAQRIVEYGYPLADDGRAPLDRFGHSLWSITDQRIGDDGSYTDINSDGVWIWTSWFGNYLAAASIMAFKALGLFATMEQQTFAARFPFALGAWMTLVVMYVAITDITGNRRLARLAVVLLTFSVPYILFARQCRSYPYLALFTLLQTWGYIRLTRGGRYGLGLFTLGGVGSFYTFFPTMVGVTGALGLHALLKHAAWRRGAFAAESAWTFLRRSVWARFAIGCLLIAALTLPFFIYTRSWDRDYDNSGVPIRESWPRLAASLRAYLVHVHTSLTPFVLGVPVAWVAMRGVRRNVLIWLAALLAAATLLSAGMLVRTVGQAHDLTLSWKADALERAARLVLDYAPMPWLGAFFIGAFLLISCLLALPGLPPAQPAGSRWRMLALPLLPILAVGLSVALVAPATPVSFGILLGYGALAAAALVCWTAGSAMRSVREAAWWESNWKQAVGLAVFAVVFSAAALANHPFYRYLMGAAPLLALATAACVLRLTRQRLAPAVPIVLVLVGCELFQYGPLYAARRLLLDPWRAQRVIELAEAYRQVPRERPMDAAYDESYFEATRFGHLNSNGYTWTMLYKNGRLNKWGENQTLEFPLYNLYLELTRDYEGPIERIIRYLAEHASPHDVVTTVYEHFPLRYYTNLLTLRTRDLVPRYGHRLPDWIIAQHWDYRPELPRGILDRAKDRNYYQLIELPDGTSALQWDNIPEPAWHHFETVTDRVDKPPVFLRLRPEAKARSAPRQASAARTSVETLP